jgi:cytochrome c oxidase subunit 1/cytochrome c oxidase subunit I+III
MPAGANPWDAPTLEWTTSSPPPPYNFAVIPYVTSRHPLWQSRMEEKEEVPFRPSEGLELIHGKEALVTTAIEAEPDVIVKMPEDSIAPFVVTLALSIGFSAALARIWWLLAFAVIATGVGLLIWLWPEAKLAQRRGGAI